MKASTIHLIPKFLVQFGLQLFDKLSSDIGVFISIVETGRAISLGRETPKLIKGSCEQLMDECFLLPLFQNKSLCETLHKKMS